MLRSMMLLLGMIAVSCTGGGTTPPPPQPTQPPPPPAPEPPTRNLLQSSQPWMVNSWVPQEVELDQEFEMRITLVNRSDQDQVLETVHFSEEYFKGVEVLGTSPARESRDSHLGPGIREYPLGLPVPAKGQGGMVLSVRAIAEGTYYPTMSVCVTHPRSEWTERFHSICTGHADVAEGMATNSQPLAHEIRKVKIVKKSGGE